MDRTEKVELTNMCMVRDGSKVLVLNRKDPNWSGVTFPGGHVEKGESFTDAVIREVKEETGLTISCPRLCGIKDWCGEYSRYVVLLYQTEKFSGTLKASEEGDVWWEELENLPHLRVVDDMADTLRLLLEPDVGELYHWPEGDQWLKELK